MQMSPIRFTYLIALVFGLTLATVPVQAQVPPQVDVPQVLKVIEVFEKVLSSGFKCTVDGGDDIDCFGDDNELGALASDPNYDEYSELIDNAINNEVSAGVDNPRNWMVKQAESLVAADGSVSAKAVNGGLAIGSAVLSGVDDFANNKHALKLDVEGATGADFYCDSNGENCISSQQLFDGALWARNGADGYYTGNGNIGIGTANPVGAKVVVVGGVKVSNLTVESSIIAQNKISTLKLCRQDAPTECVTALEMYNFLGDPNSLGKQALGCGNNQTLIRGANSWSCLDIDTITGLWNKNIITDDLYYLAGGIAIGSDVASDGSANGGQALKIDVTGAIGGSHYCDSDGNNCVTAAELTSLTHNLASCTDGEILVYDSANSDWKCSQIIDGVQTLFASNWIDVFSPEVSAGTATAPTSHVVKTFNISHTLGDNLNDISAVCKTASGLKYNISIADEFTETPENLVSGVAFDLNKIYISLEDKVRLFDPAVGALTDTVCTQLQIVGKHNAVRGLASDSSLVKCKFNATTAICTLGL